MVPRLVTNVDARGGSIEDLVNYLCGDAQGQRQRETDIYGIVRLDDMDSSIMASTANQMALHAQYAMETNPQRKQQLAMELQRLQQENSKRTIELAAKAQEIANNRVMYAIKNLYNDYAAQNRTNSENGIGIIAPTDTEYLSAEVLQDAIAAAGRRNDQIMKRMAAINNNLRYAG
jgi:hypothetical protein